MPNQGYTFDENLNKEKAFQYIPRHKFKLTDLPSLPDNWINRLANSCIQYDTKLQKNLFEKHLNHAYSLKALLHESLQLIYHRLQGHLDISLGCLTEDGKCVLLAKLTEDIHLCTPGFHNRVNAIIALFNNHSSLEQLLVRVREKLVENVAITLNKGAGIHTWNQVSVIASIDGLGITANFENDPYTGILSTGTIRKKLQEKFQEEYISLRLPFLLSSELKGLLIKVGYVGKQEKNKSYTVAAAETMLEQIKQCLPSSHIVRSHEAETDTSATIRKYFIINEDDCICDVNWQVIRQCFAENLINNGYLKTIASPTNFLDYAYYNTLYLQSIDFSADELADIKYFLKTDDFLSSLQKVQNQLPEYFNKFQKHFPPIIRFLLNYYLMVQKNSSAVRLTLNLS